MFFFILWDIFPLHEMKKNTVFEGRDQFGELSFSKKVPIPKSSLQAAAIEVVKLLSELDPV